MVDNDQLNATFDHFANIVSEKLRDGTQDLYNSEFAKIGLESEHKILRTSTQKVQPDPYF